jgi:putative membrane protein
MRLIARLIVAVIANGVALFIASRFVPGFTIVMEPLESFAILAAILTALNVLVKPVLKLLLGPIIVLTLGLALLALNAVVLKLLDFLSEDLTIQTITALFLASLIVGATNTVFHLAQKS